MLLFGETSNLINFDLMKLERRTLMKKGMLIVLLSGFVLMLLFFLLPKLVSADRYICIDPKTRQAKIVASPSQCLKPFILHTITDAELAKVFPGAVAQNKSSRRLPIKVEPLRSADYPCHVECIYVYEGPCSYYYCCCEDGSDCHLSEPRCPSSPAK